MEIIIKITVEETNAILELLGKLPNSSNTYSLFLKIREQGLEQVNKSANLSKETVE